MTDSPWSGLGWDSWSDLAQILSMLDAGANPNGGLHGGALPLHRAAEEGSPDVVAELAVRVEGVDAFHEGYTALWAAVFYNRPDNVRALAAAGADPWLPMQRGWSPGRLALAGSTPDLFPLPADVPGLSETESEFAALVHSLITAVGTIPDDGHSLVCVAGVTAEEAVRRLGASIADPEDVASVQEDPWADDELSLRIVGVTDVPGGCVVSQPWGYGADDPGALVRLSAGTVCYGMYANPKSGNQGIEAENGVIVDSDTHPGWGPAWWECPAEEIFASYLYHGHPEVELCARAGLRLPDARAITGTPDLWVLLPR
ncbi:ankyrin repeat domain-containing protein [Nonomuraea sp. NBC_01738]|uniref:ankyrin repeat domain-containing protein n=1 Tax=Nonomuraea sp. NBC_01738 TaxID=2976003 RepID=UPI002E156DDB|nr:ankyrin repeat domain-containing protein [Nonomuraea sp. NBC_01738]